MRRRPVVVTRGRPGIAGTVARTAVVAGTATVVAKGVSGAMSGGKQQATQQAAATDAAQQAQIDQMQSQVETMQAQQAQAAIPAPDATAPAAAPGAPTDDVTSRLQQLIDMKAAGMLTDDEFALAKTRLLAG